MYEMIEIIKPDFEFTDERGSLVQLVHEGFSQFNIASSVKGAVRGNHYHKLNREAFFVIEGSFKVDAEFGGEKMSYNFKTGDMFIINKCVKHTFTYTSKTVLAVMYDVGIVNVKGEKDIII